MKFSLRLPAMAVAAGICSTAVAVAQVAPLPPIASPAPLAPPISNPSSAATSRGPGLVTGSAGSAQSVMIPGSPVNGLLLNNGNGTSSIMVPGGPSQVIPTPR